MLELDEKSRNYTFSWINHSLKLDRYLELNWAKPAPGCYNFDMRTIFAGLFLLVWSALGQDGQCQDYACDSLTVRAILDSNDRQDLSVEEVTIVVNGRINTLDMTSKNITNVPGQISKLMHLNDLYLDSNQLINLPAEIGDLPILHHLYLNHNQLTSLPAGLGNLTTLFELKVESNNLSSFPPEIGNLSSITLLLARNNLLAGLPAQIGNLSTLVRLELHDNMLTSLPLEIGDLAALTHLNIKGNLLSSIPDETGNLQELTWMNLDSNQLVEIPSEFANLSNLNWLHVKENRLTTLPFEITETKTSISLTENRLCSLPDTIAKWIDWRILYAADTNWRETQKLDDTQYCEFTLRALKSNISNDTKISVNYFSINPRIVFKFSDIHFRKTLFIYNTRGELLQSFDNILLSVTWHKPDINPGFYYFKALTNEKFIIKKFIIK